MRDEYVARLSKSRYVIFLFHGVVSESRWKVRNYTKKHVLVSRFQEICEGLLALGKPASMEDVRRAHLAKEPLPANSFVLTFDDGFENNYSVAKPVLERLGLPATFYVTTGFIDNSLPSWTDAIEIAVEHTTRRSVFLEGPNRDWSLLNTDDKINFLDFVRSYVKGDAEIDPIVFSNTICERLEVNPMDHLDQQLDCKLSTRQIRQLAMHPLFLVGAHSHSHRILSFLTDSQLESEIHLSISEMRRRIAGEILHYSYPEGLENCYNEKVIVKLREQGIQVCPTAIDGTNSIETDLFRLKRVTVT